ncbi:hypothetical protein IWW38_001424, partial [Coemansia aciculifera]
MADHALPAAPVSSGAQPGNSNSGDSDARAKAVKEVEIATARLESASMAVDVLRSDYNKALKSRDAALVELKNAESARSLIADYCVVILDLAFDLNKHTGAATQQGPLSALTGHVSSRPTVDNEVAPIPTRS